MTMIFHQTNKDAAMQELFEEANRGADGKWVISHGIKNRTVGSEWDYNGMIIYIYLIHIYIHPMDLSIFLGSVWGMIFGG